MNTLSKNWLPNAIGVCAAGAGVALVVAVAASGDTIGRSVTALIGGGFAFGLLGSIVKAAVARRSDRHRVATQPGYAPASATVIAMPPPTDATASEYDSTEPPAFAPVLSLTEAQVQRQRTERQSQQRRTVVTRA